MKALARPRRLEAALVVAVALHSYAIAVCLMAFTDWSGAFGGWGEIRPRFFARQAGVFHAVVATGYLLEYYYYRGVRLLLVTKLTAVVFLVYSALLWPSPWAIPASAVGDGLMGLAVGLVRLWVRSRPALLPGPPAADRR